MKKGVEQELKKKKDVRKSGKKTFERNLVIRKRERRRHQRCIRHRKKKERKKNMEEGVKKGSRGKGGHREKEKKVRRQCQDNADVRERKRRENSWEKGSLDSPRNTLRSVGELKETTIEKTVYGKPTSVVIRD